MTAASSQEHEHHDDEAADDEQHIRQQQLLPLLRRQRLLAPRIAACTASPCARRPSTTAAAACPAAEPKRLKGQSKQRREEAEACREGEVAARPAHGRPVRVPRVSGSTSPASPRAEEASRVNARSTTCSGSGSGCSAAGEPGARLVHVEALPPRPPWDRVAFTAATARR